MFDLTWRWAGQYRTTEKNIGLAPEKISVSVRNLLEDIRVQIKHRTEAIDQIAARFHHRLVSIHPFPNGNGRTARFLVNSIAVRYGLPAFMRLRPRPGRAYELVAERAMAGDWQAAVAVFDMMYRLFLGP